MKSDSYKTIPKKQVLKSEELFSALIKSTKEAVIAIGNDGLVFLFNPAAETMFGQQAESIVGQGLDELMPKEYRKKHRKYIKSFFSNGISDQDFNRILELPGLRSNGEIFPISISLSAGQLEDQKYVMAVVRDISEQKRVGAAIQASEDKYRSLQENLPLGIYQTTKDAKILSVNPALVSLLGFKSRFEVLNQSLSDLYFDKKNFTELMDRLKNEDSLTNYEVQFIKSDGLPLWVSLNVKAVRNDDGDILYIDGIMEDISERKQVEQALIESEEKYRILAETAQDIIIVHDLSGTILYINQAGLKCLGYSPDQIIGNSIIDFIVPENRQDMSERQKRRLEGDTGLSLFNIEIVDSSNNHMPIEISSSIFKEENKPAMCLMYGRDLSARKKLEDQLHQSQKMDSIGTLAGGIAHDFNNLLTIINGLSEIALKKMENDDPLFRDLRSIHAAGKKAEDLTRKLLGFSRKQIIHPKIIDINVLISDFEKMLRRLIREDIRIKMKLSPQVLHIKADPGQIEQILINMVVNARDAISEQSGDIKKLINVRTLPIQIDKSDLINYPDSRPGYYILISVSDTGIGMDRMTIDRVFEPFFTTKEKGHGTGLGMATVYGIVKQNHGFITVESTPGKGSTINIYWPSVDKEFAKDDPYIESLPEDERLRGTECILVAEDDKDVLYFTSFALRNLGYTVLEANSGQEALQIIKNIIVPKTATENIDLVITDLIMPGMNGKELAKKIAEISDSIKVIFTSGYTEDYITDNDIIAQEDNFLQKPFTINMIAQKVRETIDFE